MRCVICDKEKLEGDLLDFLTMEDPLCHQCRSMLDKKKIHFTLQGVPVESTYVYNETFSSYLLQYKECGDEALQDIFVYPIASKLPLCYFGYTLCLMPSSKEKQKERGFHHLDHMFSKVKMKRIDPFMKVKDISQKNLSKSQRKEMLENIILKKDIILPKKLLLVDDTITTGATILAALSCLDLKKHKVKIYTVSASSLWLG